MAIPGILTTEVWDYDPLFTQTKEAAYDIDGRQVILKDAPGSTMPNGGAVFITQLLDFAYGEATNAGMATQIAASLLGATDGIKEVLIRDDSIDTTEVAQMRADSELARLSQIPYTLSFSTFIGGWQPGQLLHFVVEDAGIDTTLVVNQVDLEFIPGALPAEAIKYSIQAATYPPEDMVTLLTKSVKRALRPVRQARIRMTLNP